VTHRVKFAHHQNRQLPPVNFQRWSCSFHLPGILFNTWLGISFCAPRSNHPTKSGRVRYLDCLLSWHS
jgi:hypothetical protein